MAHYDLYYFAIPGNGQASRVALALSGANWTNHAVAGPDWPALKASGRAAFGQMPFLEVTEADGSKWSLAQGHAIVRFIANRFHFAANEREQALSDSLLERLIECKASFSKHAPYSLPAAERTAKSAEWVTAEWGNFSASLDKFIALSKTGFLVGAKPTSADVAWYAFIKTFFGTLPLNEAQQKFVHTFEAVPAIQQFLTDAAKNPLVKQ